MAERTVAAVVTSTAREHAAAVAAAGMLGRVALQGVEVALLAAARSVAGEMPRDMVVDIEVAVASAAASSAAVSVAVPAGEAVAELVSVPVVSKEGQRARRPAEVMASAVGASPAAVMRVADHPAEAVAAL